MSVKSIIIRTIQHSIFILTISWIIGSHFKNTEHQSWNLKVPIFIVVRIRGRNQGQSEN